jgi:hypothetical protein
MRQVQPVNPVQRHIPPKYSPPYQKKMAGPLLDNLYHLTYDEQMRLLLKESKVFCIALFGNGNTIKQIPLMNFLGSSPNNPFGLLDIVNCTSKMEKGGKKNAQYIARLLKPIISQIEQTKDPNNQRLTTMELLTYCYLMVLAMCRMTQNLPSLTPPSLSFMVLSMLFSVSSRKYLKKSSV